MWILYNLSFVIAAIVFVYLNHKLITRKIGRFIPILISIIFMPLANFIWYLISDRFLFNHFLSFIFSVLHFTLFNFSRIGLMISVVYLFNLLYKKLLGISFKISYVINFFVGLILGLSIPSLMFYITEFRIYNWLPDYSPVLEQRDWSIVFIIIYVFNIMMLNYNTYHEYKGTKKHLVGVTNLGICLIAVIIGVGLQQYNIGNLYRKILSFLI